MRVLHIIEQLRCGGPLRSLISQKKLSHHDQGAIHHIVSLLAADRQAATEASEAGISGSSRPDQQQLMRMIAEADVVQVHFWNSPHIYAWIRSELPPMRLLLWCHVNGEHAPHIIHKAMLSASDLVVATARCTLDLPVVQSMDQSRVRLHESTADFSRIGKPDRVPHEGFHVGYLGRIDFAKLHHRFAFMSRAVSVPSARFFLCGDGGSIATLKNQFAELGIAERLIHQEYTTHIKSFLSQLDVFGYPLAKGTFATAELALQEAMYAGVPPVVFSHGGPRELVQDGETGIVVHSEEQYAKAIEWLYHHPNERKFLGENAARAMRERTIAGTDEIYAAAMRRPRRSRQSLGSEIGNFDASCRGAWAYALSLDGIGAKDCMISLTSKVESEIEIAERKIARSDATIQSVVLNYRRLYPEDGYLRLWSALMLANSGRHALAVSEFNAAIARGCDTSRVSHYLRRGS